MPGFELESRWPPFKPAAGSKVDAKWCRGWICKGMPGIPIVKHWAFQEHILGLKCPKSLIFRISLASSLPRTLTLRIGTQTDPFCGWSASTVLQRSELSSDAEGVTSGHGSLWFDCKNRYSDTSRVSCSANSKCQPPYNRYWLKAGTNNKHHGKIENECDYSLHCTRDWCFLFRCSLVTMLEAYCIRNYRHKHLHST